jgi:hypothetical protein
MTKLDRAFDEYNEEENQDKLLEMRLFNFFANFLL